MKQESTPHSPLEAPASTLSADELELYIGFGQECTQKVEELESLVLKLEETPNDLEIPKEIYRILHTIKGTAASIGLIELSKFAHKFEDYIVPIREGHLVPTQTHTSVLLSATERLMTAMSQLVAGQKPIPEETFWSELQSQKMGSEIPAQPMAASVLAPKPEVAKSRKILIELQVVDELLEKSGNLTIIRDLLLQDLEELADRYPQETRIRKGLSYIEDMAKENDLLQSIVGNLRKTPVSSALRTAQRAIRDLALQLGKKVTLNMTGTNLQVDFDVCQILSDSLVHIVRNSIDHGIELPEERAQNGKSPSATIQIAVAILNEELVVTVSDDGRGIDSERIKKKAFERGLASPEKLQSMSQEAILQLIFESGFSTAEKVTEVSGRGVGLDMVMKAVTGLKGRVSVSSQLGVGTQFMISIPEKKTTNIVNAFIAGNEGKKFTIPRDQVGEVISLEQLQKQSRLFERDQALYALYKNQYIEIVRPLCAVDDESSFVKDAQGVVLIMDDQTQMIGIAAQEVYSAGKVMVKDFTTGLTDGMIFEKAAQCGRFGLLLYVDIPTAMKLKHSLHAEVKVDQ